MRFREVLCDEPGEAWPAFEVDDVVLALLLGETSGSGLARQCHGDVQATQ